MAARLLPASAVQTYQKERDEARAIIPALMKERDDHNTAVTVRGEGAKRYGCWQLRAE
jgi:hypothetical protein